MRGFFLRGTEKDPTTGDYPYLAGAPAAGDKVRVEARVYNYSTGKPTGDFTVSFRTAPVDEDLKDTAAPREIGRTTVSLAPLEMKTAAITWDTTGFAPAPGDTGQYRIYVVLDPENKVDEIYDTEAEGEIDGGQNNEGWRIVSVAPAKTLLAASAGADVHLPADSMSAVDAGTGKLGRTKLRGYVGKPMTVQVRVHSDVAHAGSRHVLLYDGDPDKGGELLSGTMAQGGDRNGVTVELRWTPRTPGAHKIYAKVLEHTGDKDLGNYKALLQVVVSKAPQGAQGTAAVLKDATGEVVGTATITPQGGDAGAQASGKAPGLAAPPAGGEAPRTHLVEVKVQGLAPGTHGIHIHEKGSCEGPNFEGAGDHFKHGEIEVGPDGEGSHRSSTSRFSLTEGEDALLDGDGAAIALHLDGDRVACGVLAPSAGSSITVPGMPNTGGGGTAGPTREYARPEATYEARLRGPR